MKMRTSGLLLATTAVVGVIATGGIANAAGLRYQNYYGPWRSSEEAAQKDNSPTVQACENDGGSTTDPEIEARGDGSYRLVVECAFPV